ncbi:MAG: biotin--[acetyl-CoA-carboxylase] ligase [Candidatus Zixiibacteriota bacterium]|nr:MAG: biotin--[acetyl-CoA-carboxylase] ligase [candidate division Zixibacteria bacterium]
MNQPETDKLADDILLFLRNPIGQVVSLNLLSTTFKVSAPQIRAALRQLENWGYGVTVTATDACLTATPYVLTETEISYNLDTEFIGKRIMAYNRVGSTNDLAAERANEGAVDGTVIIAEEQTKGRGRLGRSWHSSPASGAYISIILRPSFTPDKAPGVSLLTALVLVECLQSYCSKGVQIKWPNDVYIEGKKVAGILTELSAEGAGIHHLVVGVGININNVLSDFPPEISGTATSVRIACGRVINRVGLVQRFLERFESEYIAFCRDGLICCIDRLRRYSYLSGRQVKLSSGNRIIEGTAIDIDANGALIVERNGKTIAITCGEVTVIKD